MARDEDLYRGRYRIPSARLRGWDYRTAAVYAVTVCTLDRLCCLGEVVDGGMDVSRFGAAVGEEWLRIPSRHPHVCLDEFVVMPDHVHGILVFRGVPASEPPETLDANSLGAVVGQFKSKSTKKIRAMGLRGFAWQERFYDQILRDPDALDRVRAYIRNNPVRWKSDKRVGENP